MDLHVPDSSKVPPVGINQATVVDPPGVALMVSSLPKNVKMGTIILLGAGTFAFLPLFWCLTMLGSWVSTVPSETVKPHQPRLVASALLSTLNRGSKYGPPPFIIFLPGTWQLCGPFC